MALWGHQTSAIYWRYSIISEEDLIESMKRVEERLSSKSKPQGCAGQPKQRMSVAKKFFNISSTIAGQGTVDPRLILFQQQIRVISKR